MSKENKIMDNGQLTKDNYQLSTVNSQLKKGYKNTEIGVIPVEWEVKSLGDIGSFSKGQGIRKDQSNSGVIPCVRYGELYTRHNDYVKQFYSYISEEVAQTSKKLKQGDILFAGSGETKAEIGKSVAFIEDVEAYAGGDIVILSPKSNNSLFLGFLLNDVSIQKQKASRGQGDAVVHISATQLKQIQIPLPPLPEQTAIATVLSDTDHLLQALQKKIAKKQAIKKGAMQVLLSPYATTQIDNEQMTNDNYQLSTVNSQLKKGWVVKTLGEVCDVRDGTHQTPNYQTTGVPFYSVESVSNNDFKNTKYISLSEHKFLTKNWKIEKGDILMTRIGSVGVCKYIDWDVDASFYVSLALLKPKIGICAKFLTQYSTSEMFKNEVDMNSLLFAIPKKINLGNISNIKLNIPKSIEEQTQIATILSDMDKEIENLEKKLAKYKQVKQGLMQVLLTGKIRLV